MFGCRMTKPLVTKASKAIPRIAPAGGGVRVTVGGSEVRVVTPQSPIARALLGKHEGDELELRTPQGVRECSIASVS